MGLIFLRSQKGKPEQTKKAEHKEQIVFLSHIFFKCLCHVDSNVTPKLTRCLEQKGNMMLFPKITISLLLPYITAQCHTGKCSS